jgi:hypothetical protein
MENLIILEDFKQPFAPYGGADSAVFVNRIITQYQEGILIKILGEIEYRAFEEDLSTSTEMPPVPTLTEWDYFLNGHTYTHDGVKYVYPGIKPVLTKFCYYYWQRQTVSDLAETGNVRKELLNSQQVIPMSRMRDAYNIAIYDIKNSREYGSTVYNFLDHMQQDNNYYPDWDFTEFKKINTFNL